MDTDILSPAAHEVWATIKAFNRAFADNDVERYFTFIDGAITVLTPGNPYRVEGTDDDREGFEFGLREGYGRVAFFQEMQPHVQLFGDTAVVSYFTRGYYGAEGKGRSAYLRETDVLVKTAEGWKIVHIHVSATHGS